MYTIQPCTMSCIRLCKGKTHPTVFQNSSPCSHNPFGKCYDNLKWSQSPFSRLPSQPLADDSYGHAHKRGGGRMGHTKGRRTRHIKSTGAQEYGIQKEQRLDHIKGPRHAERTKIGSYQENKNKAYKENKDKIISREQGIQREQRQDHIRRTRTRDTRRTKTGSYQEERTKTYKTILMVQDHIMRTRHTKRTKTGSYRGNKIRHTKRTKTGVYEGSRHIKRIKTGSYQDNKNKAYKENKDKIISGEQEQGIQGEQRPDHIKGTRYTKQSLWSL